MYIGKFFFKRPEILLTVILAAVLSGCSLASNTVSQSTPAAILEAGAAQNTIVRTPQPQDSQEVEVFTNTVTATPEVPTALPSPGVDYLSIEYPPSEIEYVIPLTVRHVGADRASLFFELDQPAQGQLIYRPQSPELSYGGQVPIDPTQTRHMIDLDGLAPDKEYVALVLLGRETESGSFKQPTFDGETWGAVNFNTQGELPLRIGVLGDASFGDEATTQLVQLMAGMDLDFVIHTGDVVYETDNSDMVSSYVEKFYKPFSPLLHKGPVYTVMGNHDYDASVQYDGAPFYDYAFPPFEDPTFEYPPERRGNQFYAHTMGDIQFLFLDSQAIFGEGGRAEQDAWMKERLADPRFRVTIPIFHVSPYSSSIVHPDDGTPVRQSWNYLFEEANVPLVFSGHFHHYERLSANDITYIVSGGGSSTLYAEGARLPESHIFAARTHFVLLEIYQDRIELKAISKEGDTFDQATIPLN